MNHGSVKSFGAQVTNSRWWRNEGRILYLHSCGIWGQSSKMKGPLSSKVNLVR